METIESIIEWQMETFGKQDPLHVATRTNEEMAELVSAILYHETDKQICEECADMVIMLTQVCAAYGGDLLDEVDKKMAINRKREWIIQPNGRAQHK